MEFQAIVVIGFIFANITNKPNKSTVIRHLMATCLKILRDTAKCIFSSFPVFRMIITNGAFSGILRFIALCRDRYGTPTLSYVNLFKYMWCILRYMPCILHYMRCLSHYTHCLSYYMRYFRHYMRYFCNDMQCFRRYMRCFLRSMWWLCHYMK